MTIKEKMINYLKGKGWIEKRDLAKAIGQKDVSNLSRNIRNAPGVFEQKKDGKRNMIRLTKKGKKEKKTKIPKVPGIAKGPEQIKEYLETFPKEPLTNVERELARRKKLEQITPKEAGEEVKKLVKKKIAKPKEIVEVHPEVEKKVIAGVSIAQLRTVKKEKSKLKDLINELVLNLPVRKVDYAPYGMKTSQEYRTYLLKMIDLLRKSDGSWIKQNIKIKGRQIEMD